MLAGLKTELWLDEYEYQGPKNMHTYVFRSALHARGIYIVSNGIGEFLKGG